MTEAELVVGLIPARGGSKSIPRKNLVMLAGRPLLAYTAAAASAARCLDRTILSTDDLEIAEVGRALGLEVPFVRPTHLAGDAVEMIPVMHHVLDWLAEQGIPAATLVLLQPTSPLRQARHIDEAILLLNDSGAETVVSVVEVPHQYGPASVMTKGEDGRLTPFFAGPPILRRQDKPRVFARNGPAILAVRSAPLRRGTLYGEPTLGYCMSTADSLDIDEPEDLWLAEQYIRRREKHDA
jgi:CMP-N,N'-diacetyllegionaminic acid synthase